MISAKYWNLFGWKFILEIYTKYLLRNMILFKLISTLFKNMFERPQKSLFFVFYTDQSVNYRYCGHRCTHINKGSFADPCFMAFMSAIFRIILETFDFCRFRLRTWFHIPCFLCPQYSISLLKTTFTIFQLRFKTLKTRAFSVELSWRLLKPPQNIPFNPILTTCFFPHQECQFLHIKKAEYLDFAAFLSFFHLFSLFIFFDILTEDSQLWKRAALPNTLIVLRRIIAYNFRFFHTDLKKLLNKIDCRKDRKKWISLATTGAANHPDLFQSFCRH